MAEPVKYGPGDYVWWSDDGGVEHLCVLLDIRDDDPEGLGRPGPWYKPSLPGTWAQDGRIRPSVDPIKNGKNGGR